MTRGRRAEDGQVDETTREEESRETAGHAHGRNAKHEHPPGGDDVPEAPPGGELAFRSIAHFVGDLALTVAFALYLLADLVPVRVPSAEVLLVGAGGVAVVVTIVAYGLDYGILPTVAGHEGGGAR